MKHGFPSLQPSESRSLRRAGRWERVGTQQPFGSGWLIHGLDEMLGALRNVCRRLRWFLVYSLLSVLFSNGCFLPAAPWPSFSLPRSHSSVSSGILSRQQSLRLGSAHLCYTVMEYPSWKGPARIMGSNSWLHTEPPKPYGWEQSSNILWSLVALGHATALGSPFHVHHPLVQALSLTPTWPFPGTAPCLSDCWVQFPKLKMGTCSRMDAGSFRAHHQNCRFLHAGCPSHSSSIGLIVLIHLAITRLSVSIL